MQVSWNHTYWFKRYRGHKKWDDNANGIRTEHFFLTYEIEFVLFLVVLENSFLHTG